MNMQLKTSCLAMIATLVSVSISSGALVLNAQQAVYVAAANASVIVPVYLTETSGQQLVDGQGLFSIGFNLSLDSGTGYINQADRNPLFDRRNNGSTLTFPLSSNDVLRLWAEQDTHFNEITGGPGADGLGSVLLATLTINAGAAGDVYHFSDFGAGDQFVTYTGSTLDQSVTFGSFSVVVPEPTAMIFGSAMLALWGRRRNSR